MELDCNFDKLMSKNDQILYPEFPGDKYEKKKQKNNYMHIYV